MITNKIIAQKVSSMLLDISGQIDESVALVKDNCSEEEFLAYRTAAGAILGAILMDALNPIFSKNPEISPSELRHFYEISK